jgi:hypothetical protein
MLMDSCSQTRFKAFDSFGHVIFPQSYFFHACFHIVEAIGTLVMLQIGGIFQFPSFFSLSMIINVSDL